MSGAQDRLCLKRCQRQSYQLFTLAPPCCYSLLYILYWETLVPIHSWQDSRLFYREKKGHLLGWEGQNPPPSQGSAGLCPEAVGAKRTCAHSARGAILRQQMQSHMVHANHPRSLPLTCWVMCSALLFPGHSPPTTKVRLLESWPGS